jgi:DNA-binding NtrC family response regulator
VADARFREDLFHRLAAFRVRVPPLRERKEDLPALAQHFANLLSGEMGLSPQPLAREVLDTLQKHNFPGNVRELRNLIEQALIRSGGRGILPEHVAPPRAMGAAGAKPESAAAPAPGGAPAADLPLNLKALERLAIRNAMTSTGGNVSEAARLLGIGRSKLYRELGRV